MGDPSSMSSRQFLPGELGGGRSPALSSDEREEFARLYEVAMPAMRQWVSSRLAGVVDSAEREDVIMMTWVRAIQYRASFVPGDRVIWLLAILRNTSMSYLVSRRRLEESAHLDSVCARVRHDTEVQQSTTRRLVSKALAMLKPLERALVHSYFQEDASCWAAKLAEQFGIKSGTMRVKKHRVMKKLGRQLRQHMLERDGEPATNVTKRGTRL